MYGMYLRKSRADDPNETMDETLAKHEKLLFDLAESMHIDRSEIIVLKEVVSGESIANRPEIQRGLKLIMDGVIDQGMFAVDSQRLARGDTLDQGTILRVFSLTKVKIITPLKIINPADEFDEDYFEFDLFMGRREYKMINRRMQRGRHISVQEGYYVGSVAPYGYNRCRYNKSYSLEINQEEYYIFTLMKDMAIEGMGTTNIANKLNEMGFKPRKGDRWTTATVRGILINKTNLGLIKWNSRKEVKKFDNNEIIKTRPINKEAEYYPGLHPAIITQEEYDTIIEQMKARNNAPIKKNMKIRNPLAGLIVCSDCGRNMVRRPYKKNQDSLICPTSNCKNVASYVSVVEERIIESLKVILNQYKIFVDDYDHSNKDKYVSSKKTRIETLDKEIEKLHGQINKACEMLELGAYSVALFKERKKTLDDKIRSLEKEKATIEKESEDEKVEQYRKAIPKIEKAVSLYFDASIEERNKLLKSVIEKCYYKKEVPGSRWKSDAMKEFKLEIHMKV